VSKAFEPKIKGEIIEYLREMNISKLSFKMVATETLSAKPLLIKFLDDI